MNVKRGGGCVQAAAGPIRQLPLSFQHIHLNNTNADFTIYVQSKTMDSKKDSLFMTLPIGTTPATAQACN
jgi:hypothetical protein